MTVEQAGQSGESSNGKISADEVALYDRQIRLWGMAAQERMRNAHVLVISIKALANEVIKNLVLAGIGAITLLDADSVSEEDLGAQFLVDEDDVGRPRAVAAAEKARRLNPRVLITADTDALHIKPAAFFTSFDITVACDCDLPDLVRINAACRTLDRPFYAAEVPGTTGFIFADLVSHDYTTEREVTHPVTGEKAKTQVSHHADYQDLATVMTHAYGATLRPKVRARISPVLPLTLALLSIRGSESASPSASPPYRSTSTDSASGGRLRHSDITLEAFKASLTKTLLTLGLSPPNPSTTTTTSTTSSASNTFTQSSGPVPSEAQIARYLSTASAELSSVAAIVGGVLAQDVLNVLAAREHPVDNLFVFDAETCAGPIYKL